ncbi:rod shape-determining protein [Spiroplasma floricola]|uniref:Cell shape-determining protein MreB n=1 Tax=Spiroplasma floricola 23-6 TaxID=1336749 RepID=A0A2K8SFG1_9MOLU|nr:rod shape-determining protein [Spiroplasma floricola]AUB32174.1 cell shape determining protein MreB [Spiroplasma floricola 23-6]
MASWDRKREFVALDLGTANVVAYLGGQGIIYNEPSTMAYDVHTNTVIASGEQAYEMIGKTKDDIRMVVPLVDGVIADLDAAKDLIKIIFSRIKLSDILKNALVVLACPSGVTELERSALKQVVADMGARNVLVEEEVKLSAIGAGINISIASGHLVVDIGGGTTDIAIISAGDIVISRSIKVAGNHFDEEIRKYIRAEYNVLIGIKTAEKIKIEIGALTKIDNGRTFRAFGRDVISGLPREVIISPDEVKNALLAPFSKITDLIVEVMENTPAELAGDIIRNGITICGGGALIRGIDTYFESIFQLKVIKAQDPLLTVIEGTKEYEKQAEKWLEIVELRDSREYNIK